MPGGSLGSPKPDWTKARFADLTQGGPDYRLQRGEMNDSVSFSRAVGDAWEDLSKLVEADWPEFESKVLVWLRLLETPGEDHTRIREEMLAYFGKYPAAR